MLFRSSYLELADFIIRNGAEPDRDLEQLWRRIVFFICVSNSDNHLRNHGFLQVPGHGWRLSPAYDVNPSLYATGLLLNISETDNALDLDLAYSVAPLFRVKDAKASDIVTLVTREVRGWRRLAEGMKIGRAECDRMAPAFRVADSGHA